MEKKNLHYLLLLFIGLVLIVLTPKESEGKSNSVLFSNNSLRASSNSQWPWGRGQQRRPVQRSRRSMMMQSPTWYIGVQGGTANSLTDASGTAEVARFSVFNTQWATTSFNAGIFGRYKILEEIGIQASLKYAQIHGADSLSPEGSSRHVRNFYFSNNIIEFAVQGEVFLPKPNQQNPFDLYGFLGLAVFHHDPVLTVPDPENYDFAEIDNIQVSLPMGIGGIYHWRQQSLSLGYEIGWRKTFTDYLDGFTRPASQGNDSYFFGTFKIAYTMGEVRRGSVLPRF